MATLAHPTSEEFGRPQPARAGARATLERAVDAAPSRIPPPRGWLRRLFARDRSARALIERYRLWPEIEYAYERITREFGTARVRMTAEDDYGESYIAMDCRVSPPRDTDTRLDFEEALTGELIRRLGKRSLRLTVLIHGDYPREGADE
jgi:hypothetical protein